MADDLRRFNKPHTIGAPVNAQDIDDNFDRIFQLVRSLRAAVLGLPTGGADIPNPLPINRGGTGAQNAQAAFDNLSPLTTLGDLLTHDGTNNVRLALGTDGYILVARATGPTWEMAAIPVHQLLDNTAHDDTATAPPSRGAVIVAGYEDIGGELFWLDGDAYGGVSGDANLDEDIWLDGDAFSSLGSSDGGGTTGSLLWRRLQPPPMIRTFLQHNGTDTVFGPIGDVGQISASAQPKAKVYLGTLQTIPSGSTVGDLSAPPQSATAVEWEIEDYDVGGFWDASVPRRLTVPPDAAGFYLVTFQASWAQSSGGRKAGWIFVNGQRRGIGGEVPDADDNGLGMSTFTAWQGRLEAGDYVEAGVQQMSGSPLDLLFGTDSTQLSITKLA